MAFLDEIAAILAGSSSPFYPASSGSYWTGFDSTDPGLYFQASTEVGSTDLFTLTTAAWPTGVTGNPTSDLAYLTSFGGAAAGANTSWPIFRGHLPDSTVIGDKAVALVNTAGGPEPGGDVSIEPRGLQVLVRGVAINQTATGYEDAMDEAVSVRDTLHEYTGADPSLTHYVGVWCESGPFFAGFDASWRPLLSINFRCWRART